MIASPRAVRFAVLMCLVLSGAARGSVAYAAGPAVSPRIVGVTVDDLRRLPAVLDSLRALPRRPWVRVVFDVDSSRPADPGRYVGAVRRLAGVGSVLGELIDSSDLRRLTTAQVATRAAAFVRGLGRSVAMWEVGNEVNGDWAGAPADVASKVRIAYDTVHRHGGRTALTLYENTGCGDGPGELSPVAWAKRFLAARVRSGLDDVLLSFYESQCAGQRPSPLEWTQRFRALHRVFPAARLGFGEIGMPEPATPSTRAAAAAAIIAYYYRLPVTLPFYIGGGFYWYFAEDMVPRTSSPLWTSLAQVWGAARMQQAAARRMSAGPAPPPPHAGFSYQLGGPFRVGAGVSVVDRDWHVPPALGAYGICYVNAYQAQPEELGWWRTRHPSLLLRRSGRPVIDQGWNEQLLDTSTAVKRRAIAAIIGGWSRACARAGYRAVEPDNLDSFTRSHGALTVADNLALARLLVASAHAAGLAIAQKNAAELAGAGHRLGFDFAIAEDCQAYAECDRYLNAYGPRVIEIEYPDDGGQRNFDRACRLRGDRISIVYRDRNVTPAGQPGFLERRCPHRAAAASDPRAAAVRSYPWHTRIVSTTFWVGEIFDRSAPDGSQVYSTYDSQWERHYGGCDGVVRSGRCETERRLARHHFFPSAMKPHENPFYLDLPFDDLNDPTAFAERGRVVPWAHDSGYRSHIHDPGFSLMKNRWVQIVGPNGHTCYGQIEDAGPGLYHDSRYVFGHHDRRPANRRYNGAGMDVSPALNGCLGFGDINGENDRVAWRFVERPAVSPGPWLRTITTSGVTANERS